MLAQIERGGIPGRVCDDRLRGVRRKVNTVHAVGGIVVPIDVTPDGWDAKAAGQARRASAVANANGSGLCLPYR